MVIRVTMPEHIRRPGHDVGHDRRSASSGSGSSTSTDSHQRAPMGIPNIRYVEAAPPPLPPPRYIDGLASGNDLSWELQNREEEFGPSRKLAPINHNSSLFGGYMASARGPSAHDDDDDEGVDMMEMDDDYERKGSTSTIRSPSQAELDTASLAVGRIQSLARRPASPSAASNQRLHGEKPLAQQNLSRSSHAYDKHLLSKIGKPSSPPRRHNSEAEDGPSLLAQRRLSMNPRDVGLSPLSMVDTASSSSDHISRWVTSPITSAGVSPALRQPWRDSAMDYRSPFVDESAPPSVVDRDFFPRLREGSRHLPSGHENSLSHASRSHRGSYDQAMFAEPETDLSIEDNGTFRKLSLGDSRFPLAARQEAITSKPGMKRRAISPPTDMVRDDKVPTHLSEPHHRVTASFAARSPNTQFLKYGSVSSTASSVRPESYTSSAGLSAAGSSVTSISSYPGHSPARLSPSVEAPQDSPYLASVAPSKPVLSISTSKKLQDRTSYEDRAPHIISKMSSETPADESRPAAANRLTGHYICECCPKKPKKFDTENELRLHEMEKQYSCQYCNNRFKNKNEAERHQNSLHLRRHSWSCAAISGYEAAFHPSTAPAAQTPNGPSSDACGYCGEEFPNQPQPDWERRCEHLTAVHKFGECNQSKKFFRADHFRQHLKHSHAGRSGKWTNMLESACMKDEPQDLGNLATSSPGEQSTRSTDAP